MNRTRPPRQPVSPELCSESKGLDRLVSQAQILSKLDTAIRQFIPEPFRENCRVAKIDCDRLVFIASSPLIAARLRTLQSTILPDVQRLTDIKVAQLVVKVSPTLFAQNAHQTGIALSKAGSRALRGSASSLSDPELKALFLELASLADS